MPIGNLKVNLVGKGAVTLRQSNYVTTGGEASIYKLGKDIVVKVFTDPAKMRADRMSEKINRLAQFKHKFIVAPLGVAEDEKHEPIGYYMGFVEGEPMSRVFTTAFRQREGFTDQDAIRLVHNMREAVIFAHGNGAILVDANELNWLMRRTTEAEPRIVDVDSWQLGQQWPARVIMPSIRDMHSKVFDERTDWFSWAVVSFQVFSGIHPYKGRHDAYQPNELERRMRDNVSVFNKDVRTNAAVRDFSAIPGALLDWYRDVFENGARLEPPSPLDQTHRTTIVMKAGPATTATGQLVFEMLLDNGNNPVVRVWPCGLVMRQDGSLFDLATKLNMPAVTPALSANAEIVRSSKGFLIGDRQSYHYLTATTYAPLSLTANTYKIVRSGNRMFAVTDMGLTELSLHEMDRPVLTIGQTWQTMFNSTEWFEGMGVQNSLGAKYLVLPFGEKGCSFIRTTELDDVNIINAKAGPRFVSVIALNKAGEYKKFEFCLDREYEKYTLWKGDTDSPDMNLAVLPNGVCATIVKDGELSIFVPKSGDVRVVPDKAIDTSMQLAVWDEKVVYIKNGALWWVRLK